LFSLHFLYFHMDCCRICNIQWKRNTSMWHANLTIYDNKGILILYLNSQWQKERKNSRALWFYSHRLFLYGSIVMICKFISIICTHKSQHICMKCICHMLRSFFFYWKYVKMKMNNSNSQDIHIWNFLIHIDVIY